MITSIDIDSIILDLEEGGALPKEEFDALYDEVSNEAGIVDELYHKYRYCLELLSGQPAYLD